MGGLGTVLSSGKGKGNETDVVVDPGGGNNVTAHLAQTAGVDAPPLPDDTAVMVSVPGMGVQVVVAFIEHRNAGSAKPGEFRIFSRDDNGAVKADIHLKGDGTINLNGATIDPDGNIESPGDISAGGNVSAGAEVTALSLGPGVKLSTHLHLSGAPGAPTSPPTPGT